MSRLFPALALAATLEVGCQNSDKTVVGEQPEPDDTAVTDDSGAPCVPSAEIAYDGVDQDCDGGDLVDADGDGWDAVEVGGDDCDDADAGVSPDAEEEPYDGVDQDCDGGDLVDVDGDGWDAVEAGGTDCGDEDLDVFPGAIELPGDEQDQDCDSLIDEFIACADGTGDYAGVQEAVDAVPDGSTIEICPGVYHESVYIYEKSLIISGGGEKPEDVVFDASDGEAGFRAEGIGAYKVESEMDITIRWLRVQPNGGDALLQAKFMNNVTFEYLDLCGEAGNGEFAGGLVLDIPYSEGFAIFRRSRVCNLSDVGHVQYMGLCGNRGRVLFEENVFTGNESQISMTLCSDGFNGPPIEPDELVFKNNIFYNNSRIIIGTYISGDEDYIYLPLRIENNTIVNSALSFSLSSYLTKIGPGDPSFQNNIISHNNDIKGEPVILWRASDSYMLLQFSTEESIGYFMPDPNEHNIVWDLDQLCEWYTKGTEKGDFTIDCGLDFSLGTIKEEPEFDPNSAVSLLFPLVGGNVDGIGALTVDNPWWEEVPWPLP